MPIDEYPIQVVARRTGLSPDVLRVWEKRYRAVTPSRTATGRRIYTNRDIERLLLFCRAIDTGRKIGQIAHLSDTDLLQMVTEDEMAVGGADAFGGSRAPSAGAENSAPGSISADILEDCLKAIREMNPPELEALFSRAEVEVGRIPLLETVLIPLMDRIGDLWEAGEFRVIHEHLASSVVRSYLGNLQSAYSAPGDAPRLICTTPTGQLHEFGALIAAATAAAVGWRTTYLGPSLPAAEIAAAARRMEASAVALSLISSEATALIHELIRIRSQLPDEIHLILGGRGAESCRQALEGMNVIIVRDIGDFRSVIQQLPI